MPGLLSVVSLQLLQILERYITRYRVFLNFVFQESYYIGVLDQNTQTISFGPRPIQFRFKLVGASVFKHVDCLSGIDEHSVSQTMEYIQSLPNYQVQTSSPPLSPLILTSL